VHYLSTAPQVQIPGRAAARIVAAGAVARLAVLLRAGHARMWTQAAQWRIWRGSIQLATCMHTSPDRPATTTWLRAMMTGLPFSFTAPCDDLFADARSASEGCCSEAARAKFVVTVSQHNAVICIQSCCWRLSGSYDTDGVDTSSSARRSKA